MTTRLLLPALAVCALLLACSPAPTTESTPAAEPVAQEAPAPQEALPPITQAHAKQINPSLSYEQVVELLGREGEIDPVEFYAFADQGAQVTLRDGKVVAANGVTGVAGLSYEELVAKLGGEGQRLERTRYVFRNDGPGELAIELEGGVIKAVSSSMLPK